VERECEDLVIDGGLIRHGSFEGFDLYVNLEFSVVVCVWSCRGSAWLILSVWLILSRNGDFE